MLKFHILLSAVLFTILSSSLIAQTPKSWKSYSQANITISYPSDWTIKTGNTPQEGFFLFSPRTRGTDRYRENVNLSIEKNRFPDLKTCVLHSLEKTNVVVSNMRITEKSAVRFQNFPAMKVVFCGNKGTIYLTYSRYYFLHNGQLYTLSFVAESSQLSHYLPTATTIMEALRVR